MPLSMFRIRRVVFFVTLAIAAAGIFFDWSLLRHQVPETDEISRVASPSGAWVARVEMVVYGDHHFVNDARYEVRIGHVGGQDKGVLVYSAQASGAVGVVTRWQTNEWLVIEDSASVLQGAFKQPHPVLRIEYRPI